MNSKELIKLLEERGYIKHPLLNFYWNNKSLGYCFVINEDSVSVLRNKWKTIDLNAAKTFKYHNFPLNVYNLQTIKPRVVIPKKKPDLKPGEKQMTVDMYDTEFDPNGTTGEDN